MTTAPETPGARRRRNDWRGERRPVLVRLPAPVAERLCRAAESRERSMSETAAELLETALGTAAAAPLAPEGLA